MSTPPLHRSLSEVAPCFNAEGKGFGAEHDLKGNWKHPKRCFICCRDVTWFFLALTISRHLEGTIMFIILWIKQAWVIHLQCFSFLSVSHNNILLKLLNMLRFDFNVFSFQPKNSFLKTLWKSCMLSKIIFTPTKLHIFLMVLFQWKYSMI